MNIIYMHTNKINGKSYIGVTSKTMEYRWKQHCINSKRTQKPHFQRALIKYGFCSSIWNHCILEENVSDSKKEEREKYWIHYYDTYNNGYNSTIGGDFLEGYIPPQGDSHWASIKESFYFFKDEHEGFHGTINQMAEKYSLNKNSVRSLVKGRQFFLFGWYISCPLFSKRKYRAEEKTKKIILKTKKSSPKRGSAEHRRLCSERSKGEKNGMYGKTRCDKVKNAVSKRRRSEADQTKRDWVNIHSGDIEKQITCIALRDKYEGLLISKLNIVAKKIVDKRGNLSTQHKGWKIL